MYCYICWEIPLDRHKKFIVGTMKSFGLLLIEACVSSVNFSSICCRIFKSCLTCNKIFATKLTRISLTKSIATSLDSNSVKHLIFIAIDFFTSLKLDLLKQIFQFAQKATYLEIDSLVILS